MNELAQRTESILGGHDDYSPGGQQGRIERGARGSTACVTATLEKNHDGLIVRWLYCGSKNIQGKTILIAAKLARSVALRTERTKRESVSDTVPGGDWCGWPPTKIPDRW